MTQPAAATGSSRRVRTQAKTVGSALRPNLISPVNFLLATRDTGYKSTSMAVAEFIDSKRLARSEMIAMPPTVSPTISSNAAT